MGFIWVGAAAFLIWLLQGILYQHFWMQGLDARLEFSAKAVREGESGILKEIVENRKLLPLPVLQVGFTVDRSLEFISGSNVTVSDQAYRRDIFAILPYQQITRSLGFLARKRGYYQCGQIELVGKELFLEGSYVRKVDTSASLYVYPKAIDVKPAEVVCQEMLGEFFWKKKLYEDPFAFQRIRDYEVWDGFRQVNWKASARTGALKVNVYENTALPRVQILLNLEQEEIWEDERLMESVIQIGAALAQQWIARGIATAVRTNGKDILTGQYASVDAGAGTGHLTAILQMLSRVQVADIRMAQENRACGSPFWNDVQTQMMIYVSAGENEENLKILQQCAVDGAGILWIQPVMTGSVGASKSGANARAGIGLQESGANARAGSGLQLPYMQWRITT